VISSDCGDEEPCNLSVKAINLYQFRIHYPEKNLSQKMSTSEERPLKKTKYNETSTNNSIVHLCQDELSHIINCLPIPSKLMLACSCKSLFQMIDTMTREHLCAYDKSVPLSQLWIKYNEFIITNQESLRELKTLLEKEGSFTNVTKKVTFKPKIHILKDKVARLSDLIELLSIPTGRNTTVQIIANDSTFAKSIIIPEITGHTLKYLDIKYSKIDAKILNLVCKLEYLSLYRVNNVPELDNTCILQELKYLEFYGQTRSTCQDLCKLIPNLEVLRMPQQQDEFPRCFVDNCPKLKEIFLDRDDYSANVTDEDVLYMAQHLPELRKLEIASNSFTGSGFNKIGKYAKKLEYLYVMRSSNEYMDLYQDAEIGGGQLPSLKYFTFTGLLETDDQETYDFPKLFDSVIRNCPNIIQ
jgi:hypothetical protein